jgi:hypothetical protein
MHDLMSARAVVLVVEALNVYADSIRAGALLTIDDRRARVRVLPLRRP